MEIKIDLKGKAKPLCDRITRSAKDAKLNSERNVKFLNEFSKIALCSIFLNAIAQGACYWVAGFLGYDFMDSEIVVKSIDTLEKCFPVYCFYQLGLKISRNRNGIGIDDSGLPYKLDTTAFDDNIGEDSKETPID